MQGNGLYTVQFVRPKTQYAVAGRGLINGQCADVAILISGFQFDGEFLIVVHVADNLGHR